MATLRRRRALQQQATDLSRQVAVLLNEVQRLKTGRPASSNPAGGGRGLLALPAPGSGGLNPAAMDAQAVITARLVEFKDIQVGSFHHLRSFCWAQ